MTLDWSDERSAVKGHFFFVRVIGKAAPQGGFQRVKKVVIPSQCSHSFALRAAFGGCATHAPAGAVA